ncbi:formyl transferase [Aliikangiella coralliicola]|nr:formyl transferase [Aliikangiella coralliicola]
MKITILANRDLASNIALNYLVSDLAVHRLRIFLSDNVGSASTETPQALIDLKFFEQQLFNEIVFPSIDMQSSYNTPEQFVPAQLLTFDGLAESTGNPIETLNDINEPSGLEKLKDTEPDLILSIRFGKILKEQAISIPKFGVLNLHSGLLPEYQGVMATFWAMYNGERNYGTTLHYIDSAAIDAGPIIERSPMALNLEETYLENVLKLYRSGCRSMVNAVGKVAKGKAPKSSTQTGVPSYYTFPDETQLKTFTNAGLKLFDSQQAIALAKSYQIQLLG